MSQVQEQRTPIGFWVFVILAALYLLLRFAQGIAWVVERIG